jgi:hypothetical protein
MAELNQGQGQQLLSLDFVTALTVEECRAYLRQPSPIDGQSVLLQDDDGFAIRRVMRDANVQIEVRFWGTLQPVERGTWVWGTVVRDTGEKGRVQTYVPVLAVIAALFLIAEFVLRADAGMIAFWALALAALCCWIVIVWRRRHRHALSVMNWVLETLYVPPEHERRREVRA